MSLVQMRLTEFYERVRGVFFRTKEYFKTAKREKGIRQALKYLVIFTVFFLSFTTYYYLANINELFGEVSRVTGLEAVEIPLTPIIFIGFFLFLLVFLVLFAFVRYWATHIIVKIFNKKARYQDTYKAMSYSGAPGYLGGPFLLASFLLLPFLGRTWAWFFFVPSIAAYIGFELYSVYLRSKALSLVQGLGFWKALLCIYVLGFIVFMLLVIIIYLVLLIVALLIFLLISMF